MDFVLNLYRDHEAVKYILERVQLPADAARVALAIDDSIEGPFVIVTRDGRFVTCLGAGMSPGDWPVVPRSHIDGLLAKVNDRRARLELAAREMRPNEEEDDFLGRVFTRGSRLAREEFLAISAFESMLGIEPFLSMVDISTEVAQGRPVLLRIRKLVGAAARAIEAYHQSEWAVAHLALLSAAAERKDLDRLLAVSRNSGSTPSLFCAVHSGQTFYLRGAWMAARLGKGVLPTYRGALSRACDWITMFDASLGIGAVGLRHTGAKAEAKRLLSAEAAAGKRTPDEIGAVGRAFCAEWVERIMDNVEESTVKALDTGRDLCVMYGANLPVGHACRFERPEDVPEALARTAILAFDGDGDSDRVHGLTLAALPLAARASAEDFYFPRDVLRAWFGAWTGHETLSRLARFARLSLTHEPVRAPPTPGRNDPCPCGSGKKWKRCCGAKSKPVTPAGG